MKKKVCVSNWGGLAASVRAQHLDRVDFKVVSWFSGKQHIEPLLLEMMKEDMTSGAATEVHRGTR